jgi:hypothetical protein
MNTPVGRSSRVPGSRRDHRPQQAVSLLSHDGSPELEDMCLAAIRALEVRDEAAIVRSMTHGELEACILQAERSQARARLDVLRQFRLTAQAEADAWQQSDDAATRHAYDEAANARTLAGQLPASNSKPATFATGNGPPPPAPRRPPPELRPLTT